MNSRSLLDRSVQDVQKSITLLSGLVNQAITDSVTAVREQDDALAQQVEANDTEINDTRFSIEEICYALISTQQPTSTDMRIIVGAVSVATDLERIGDHTVGIARLEQRISREAPSSIELPSDILLMASIARDMVRDAVTTFLTHNLVLAEQTVARDQQVDNLHEHIYHDLADVMAKEPTKVTHATFLLWISHNLERIGDRATTICERAIYVATGELKEFR